MGVEEEEEKADPIHWFSINLKNENIVAFG